MSLRKQRQAVVEPCYELPILEGRLPRGFSIVSFADVTLGWAMEGLDFLRDPLKWAKQEAQDAYENNPTPENLQKLREARGDQRRNSLRIGRLYCGVD